MDEGAPASRARQTVLRLLALRDRSEGEIRQKLKNKGCDNDLIEKILAEFRELRYLNDEAFATRQSRYLAHDKLYGNRRIEVQLRGKGISKELIRKAIDSVRRDFPEEEALDMRIRKIGHMQQTNSDAMVKMRLARSLMGKGFPPELIFEKLDTVLEEYRHDDDGK